jgi:hypothetical protein
MSTANTTSVRIAGAIEAALEIARQFGVECKAPRVLHDSNNTVLHLAPAPVVAKVFTSVIARADGLAAARELKVAQYAANRGASVAPPSDLFPAQVHRSANGRNITFWRYVSGVCNDAEGGRGSAAFGAAVRELHEALEGYPDKLPEDLASFSSARTLLEAGQDGLALLSRSDINMLIDAYDFYSGEVFKHGAEKRVLHGDCRPGNCMNDGGKIIWHDFEVACRGPRELDCAAMDEEALANYGPVDRDLVGTIQKLVSVCVATWSGAQRGRGANVDEAAAYHLQRTKELRHEFSG